MLQIFEISRQKWDQKFNSSDLEKMNVTSIIILLQKKRDFLEIVKQCACCARSQTLGEKQQEIDFHC